MKKALRSPVMWIAFLAGLLVVIMYILGFRITYSPKLENNWDAISACAGWAAVFVAGIGSVVSVYFAIQVPKKIAEEQNRISLFEKRYEEVKRIGLILAEFDKIKNQTEALVSKYTSKKDTLQIINACNKSLNVIYENINGMYQYLFDQSICDKIKFIHDSHAIINVKFFSLYGIICDQQYVSVTDRDWHRIVSKDPNILNIQNEILDICSKVLSLESVLSVETGNSMDLSHL